MVWAKLLAAMMMRVRCVSASAPRIAWRNTFRRKAPSRVDGTSLTVNKVDGSTFELNIVPHTLEETIIADYRSGTKVNLEVDVIARYLERLLLGDKAAQPSTGGGITEAFLAEHGFMK